MNDDSDPLIDRLRVLRRVRLDDVAAVRTLARAETALASPVPPESAARAPVALVPAALCAWALFCFAGAVAELVRLFPAHRAPAGSSLVSGSSPSSSRTVMARGRNPEEPVRMPETRR